MKRWSRWLTGVAALAGAGQLVLRLAAAPGGEAGGQAPQPDPNDRYRAARQSMVQTQLATRDITDGRVLKAMEQVPRHLFVPPDLAADAYKDCALPIGHRQTISQPYIVALMTQLADPQPGDRALEIGTGCGYQAAVLSRLVERVDTVEIVRPLGEAAAARLERLGYSNVSVHIADGSNGWPSAAPFNLILIPAATPVVPAPVLEQLAIGGRLVAPIGRAGGPQHLCRAVRQPDGTFAWRTVCPVSFVPLTGRRP